MKDAAFLVDYHIWAHNKVLQQLQTITAEEWNTQLGGSFPSLHQLYEHLVIADYRWLQRWKGVPFAAIPPGFVFDNYVQVATIWQPILEEIKTLGHQFFAGGGDQTIDFITSKGASHSIPFWQTVYQVVNHGTYHRGQITNMLRMLGKQPVATDIFLFFVQ